MGQIVPEVFEKLPGINRFKHFKLFQAVENVEKRPGVPGIFKNLIDGRKKAFGNGILHLDKPEKKLIQMGGDILILRGEIIPVERKNSLNPAVSLTHSLKM
jgi:hypothetical protein